MFRILKYLRDDGSDVSTPPADEMDEMANGLRDGRAGRALLVCCTEVSPCDGAITVGSGGGAAAGSTKLGIRRAANILHMSSSSRKALRPYTSFCDMVGKIWLDVAKKGMMKIKICLYRLTWQVWDYPI